MTSEYKKIVGHMCRYGMQSSDEMGAGRIKKPTGLLTNSAFLRGRLSNRCLGGHRHIQMDGARARAGQAYPVKCSRAMLQGIRAELVNSGVIAGKNNDMMIVSEENNDPIDYLDEYIDDRSGQPLHSRMVKNARREEMESKTSSTRSTHKEAHL